MSEFTREELAARAGVDTEYVDRLVELGVVTPTDGGSFSVGTLRATRMVQSLERGGLPLEGIGEAVRSGEVSFVGLPGYDRFSGISDTTFQSLHDTSGIPLQLLMAMREAIGLVRPEPDDLVRDDELEVAPALRMTSAFGLDPPIVERFMHVYADNLRRIVESESAWYRT